MAATLDDLLYVATAQRVDIRNYLDKFEEHFQKMQGGGAGGAGQPSPPGEKAGTFFGGLKGGSASILLMFGALEKALASFGAQVAKFVQLASPVHVLRFNLALNDLQAVIGRMLLPVMEKLTGMMRKLGDALASLSPEAQKLATGLGVGAGLGAALGALATAGTVLVRVFGGIPVLIGTLVSAFVGVMSTMSSGKAIFRAFEGVVKALMSVVEVVALAVVPAVEFALVPALEMLADVTTEAAGNVRALVNSLRELAGFDPLEERSSVGAAVRPAQIGDVQSYINKAYTNAFQMGPKDDIPRASLEELKGIRAILKGMSGIGAVGAAAGVARYAIDGPTAGTPPPSSTDMAIASVVAPPVAIVASLRSLFG